jgi:hypothetical protein
LITDKYFKTLASQLIKGKALPHLGMVAGYPAVGVDAAPGRTIDYHTLENAPVIKHISVALISHKAPFDGQPVLISLLIWPKGPLG